MEGNSNHPDSKLPTSTTTTNTREVLSPENGVNSGNLSFTSSVENNNGISTLELLESLNLKEKNEHEHETSQLVHGMEFESTPRLHETPPISRSNSDNYPVKGVSNNTSTSYSSESQSQFGSSSSSRRRSQNTPNNMSNETILAMQSSDSLELVNGVNLPLQKPSSDKLMLVKEVCIKLL